MLEQQNNTKQPVIASPSQREAITFTDGTMLVAAGPGSGKTHVISQRIRYLIEEKHVWPEHILTITFTKTAALEMQKRCHQICPASAGSVFGTFHSVFYHILRTSDKYQKYTILKHSDKIEIMQKIIPLSGKTEMQKKYECEMMLQKISIWKNTWPTDMSNEEVLKAAERYRILCAEEQKLDFDDMLILCHELLSEHPDELEKWQKRFKYILVDEFQDVNGRQYELTKLLSEKHLNLFVVGDDDQAIYSFRGSDSKYMQQFLMDFQDCHRVFLEENFRCGNHIIDVAGRCISNNINRIPKQIKCMCDMDNNVYRKEFLYTSQEVEYIGEQIKKEVVQGPCSHAVLVRTNSLAERVAEQFFKMGISYEIREKRRCFYEEPMVAEILSVLRFVFEGQKRCDFYMFMNKPYRGITRAAVSENTVDLIKLTECHKKYPQTYTELKKLTEQCRIMKNMDPYGAIMIILNGMKYKKYIEKSAEGNKQQKERSEEIIASLIARAKEFRSVHKFLAFIREYCAEFWLMEENRQERDTGKEKQTCECVQIMTYHASKGLEFDCVYLPMLNEGIVPHGHMLTKQQLEEERRMFYVAITRARRKLHLTWQKETEKSLFVKEL